MNICDTQMLQDHIPLCIALAVGAGMYILDIHKCYKATLLCVNVKAGMYPLDIPCNSLQSWISEIHKCYEITFLCA